MIRLVFPVCWYLFLLLAPARAEDPLPVLPDYNGLIRLQQEQTRMVNFMPGGKVRISCGFQGSLTVEGWDRPNVMIRQTVMAWGTSHEAAVKNMDLISALITPTATDLSIATIHPGHFNLGRIDYLIKVPSYRTDLNIKSNIGSVTLKNINGWMEADTVYGYFTLVNLSGYVSVRTRRGDMLVQLKGSRWEGLQIAGNTGEGAVQLYMPVEYSTDLSLITVQGKIDVDYPPFQVDELDSKIEVARKKDGEYVSQRIRMGGGNVVFQTGKGPIRLRQYDPRLEEIELPASGK